jgi:D-cysteine desulfhydrase family pyridoxal phosphate-dependent enzyme
VDASRDVGASLPTPLERADRLAAALGGPALWVKRDDQTGLALGGNKARKLVRLVADARERGRDVLVTGGGLQSNHVRQTAAAANRAGLECHAVLAGPAPPRPSGNLLLDRILGAHVEIVDAPGYHDVERAIDAAARRLEDEGRRPYAIPIGGASTPGVLAYADAADEVLAQLDALGEAPDWVVLATGSGGTQAGLLAGLPPEVRVLGVDAGTRPDLDRAIPELADAAAAASGRPPPTGQVIVDHGHFGTHYGAVTDEAGDAIRLAARTEGMLLDPVYTAKALVGLRSWIADGRIAARDTVVFLHTGGTPALFADRYAEQLAR